MPSAQHTDSFLNALRMSGLVPDDQVLALLAELGHVGKKPEDARTLADALIEREFLTAWQAEMLLRGKHRGFQLGPYRILRPIGQGGMGSVFLAHHEMMHRRCAIKVLPNKYRKDPELLDRFQLEARAVAALDHPHIVRAYDFNKDARTGSEVYYLVMEYVEGQDLQRMVEQEGVLEYQKAADFIRQAALGLAHAHEAGFVHRDIKPANLLVDTKGTLKILDLGLAKFAQEVEKAARGSQVGVAVSGTPDYMAPEQAVDSPELDRRADIYSLGHTFYFLLVGHRPFVKGTMPELLMAHRTEQPEPICETRPDVPIELVAMIDKMTAKSPARRYRDAQELAEALQAWLSDAASGRRYSRMSALMTAAMKSKQRGTREPPPVTSSLAGPELDLAPLDDESSDILARGKSPVSDTAEVFGSDTNPSGTGSGKAKREKESGIGKRPPSGSSPSLSKPTPAAAPPQARREPAPADPLLAALSSAASAAPVVSRPARRASHGLFSSPWIWVGLGAILVVAVLLVLVVSSSSSRDPKPEGRPKPAPGATPDPPPPTTKKVSREPKSPAVGSKKSVQPPRPIAAKTTKTEGPAVAVVPPPKKTVEKTLPKETTREKIEIEDPLPNVPPPNKLEKPAGKTDAVPGKTEKPPIKPDAPLNQPPDPQKQLAGLKAIAFRLPNADTPQAIKLNAMLQHAAMNSAKREKLVLTVDASSVMELSISSNQGPQQVDVILTGELKHKSAADAEEVTIWKGSKAIAALTPRAPNGPAPEFWKKKIGEFFDQFEGDLRRARSGVPSQADPAP